MCIHLTDWSVIVVQLTGIDSPDFQKRQTRIIETVVVHLWISVKCRVVIADLSLEYRAIE